MERAAARLEPALAESRTFVPEAREMLQRGASTQVVVMSLADHYRPMRVTVEQAMNEYQQAISEWRIAVARQLVADGLSLTETGRLLGVSRQRVATMIR